MNKKILSTTMALVMALSALPAQALAENGTAPDTGSTVTEYTGKPAAHGETIRVEDAGGLEAALQAAQAGDTIVLGKDIALTEGLQITTDGIVLDGAGHRLTAPASLGAHVLNISARNVTVKNLTVDGNQQGSHHGLHVYKAQNCLLENTAFVSNGKTGLTVNASTVTVRGTLTLGGNGWGDGINVGWGSGIQGAEACTLDASGAVFKGVTKIYTDASDRSNAGEHPITVKLPAGFAKLEDPDSLEARKDAIYVPVEETVSLTSGSSTVHYYDFLQALDAARAGDTVTLHKDVTVTATLKMNKALTLEGGGRTITCGGALKGAALIDIAGAPVTIRNVKLDAGNHAKYGVQFYRTQGGSLSGVTVQGSTYAAVNLNGARDVVIADSTLNTQGYANIEYAMGGGVDTPAYIPSLTIRDVTFQSAGESGTPVMIWADQATVANMKTAMGAETTDEQVLEKIRENILNRGGAPITAYVQLGPGAESIREVAIAVTEDVEDDDSAPGGEDEDTSGGGSSDNGGSGGSGSTTETEQNPDGSTTTTVTEADGTVTETTRQPDGSTTQVVTKPDGSSTTTVNNQDGTSSTTSVSKDGQMETAVKLPEDVVTQAGEKGHAVALPMPQVPVTSDKGSAPTVTVDLSRDTSAKVEIPVKNVTAGTVAILVKADGTEQIIKTSVTTADGVAVTLSHGDTVKIVDNARNFADVAGNHWAAEAIHFTTGRDLFAGTSGSTFTPAAPMTRAMIVTVLARYSSDAHSSQIGYAQGHQWAVGAGISDGSNMSGTVSRQQLATMLYRLAGKPAVSGGLDRFSDAGSVSGYASDAMVWATQKGLIGGMGDGTLNPQGLATRAQVAAVVMRYVNATN